MFTVSIRLICSFIVFTFAGLSLSASEQLKTIQEKLKTENFYYGTIDGEMGDETSSALRRFQIHHGLKVTGRLDPETARVLSAIDSNASSGIGTGDGIENSAQGVARQVIESDQKFLKKVEPNSIPPEFLSQPASDEARTAPDGKIKEISKAELEKFVNDYLSAAENADINIEISFYADKVDYFDSGRVNRKFIERDQKNYYRKWPERHYTQLNPPTVLEANEFTASIHFQIQYEVKNEKQTARGRTENFMRLKRFDSGLKIVAVHERRISD